MAVLTAATIIANINKFPRENVPVPEWIPDDPEAFVSVRAMNARLRFELEKLSQERQDLDVRIRLAAICTCDESGQSIFTRQNADIVAQLGWAGVVRVAEAAARLNAPDVKDAPDEPETEKE